MKVCDAVCRVRVLSAAPFLPRLAKNLFAVAEPEGMPRYRRFKCSVVYKVIKSCDSWLGLHLSILYFSHTKVLRRKILNEGLAGCHRTITLYTTSANLCDD